jgi:hypothetical protein
MDEPNRYQKIKQHVKDNKKVYFAAGGGVVVGAVGVFFATGGHVTIVDGVEIYPSSVQVAQHQQSPRTSSGLSRTYSSP